MSCNILRDAPLLEAIAIALTTGEPGEVFAGAFDNRQPTQLILAKNGLPTPADITAADELMSLIASLTVTDETHLFPFIFRRCGPKINKRIQKLHTSFQDLRDDFKSALEVYEPVDTATEFPRAGPILDALCGDVAPPFATAWEAIVKSMTKVTAHGVNAGDVPTSTARYRLVFCHAYALSRARFLNTLISNPDCRERVGKLLRCLDKICEHGTAIIDLPKKAKQIFPIPYHWVMDAFIGSGESTFDLPEDVCDVISLGLGHSSLSPEMMDKLENSMRSDWHRQRTVPARLHAELRIILHLGLPSAIEDHVHPIGVSKPTCLVCRLWMEEHNCKFGTQWMASRPNGKAPRDWALPGAACSYDETLSVDKAVKKAISMRLTNLVERLSVRDSTGDERGV